MPFRKVGRNKYRGPSGRIFNLNQVRMYYARGGTFKKTRRRRKRK